MRTRTHTTNRKPFTVRIIDPKSRKSRSLTLYAGSGDTVEDIARYVESHLRRQWETTSLTDGRHQRRF